MKPYRRPSFSLSLSEIDRTRFGIRTAKAWYVPPGQTDSVMTFCRRERVSLCLTRCWAEDLEAVHTLSRQGFLLMDSLICWLHPQQPGAASGEAAGHPDGIVRPLQEGEEERVSQIAQSAFHDYRSHYVNDSRLPSAQSRDVYPDWARRQAHARDGRHEILVAEMRKKPVGFLTLELDETHQSRIGLVAVHPAFQRRGLLGRLLAAAVGWSETHGATHLIIETQWTNIAVHRACQRLGFYPADAFHTLHGWFPPSKPL